MIRTTSFVAAILFVAAVTYRFVYPQGKELVARMGQDLSVFVGSIIAIGLVAVGACLWHRRGSKL